MVSPESQIVVSRLPPGIAVTIAFGLLGYLLQGVTRWGGVAGFLCALAIYVGLGPGGFATLVTVFVLTWICTRLGSRRKQELGLMQREGGRDAGQVFANVGAAAVFAALSLHWTVLAVASVAALAEAAADTSQSEIGEIASQRAWLITSFRQVEPGTDGGVTAPGFLAGAAAAAITVAIALVVHAVTLRQVLVAAIAAMGGTIIDSLLGATLERRGLLNNDGVNLLSTVSAGILALFLIRAASIVN